MCQMKSFLAERRLFMQNIRFCDQREHFCYLFHTTIPPVHTTRRDLFCGVEGNMVSLQRESQEVSH